jgi:hypothetical protein
MICTWIGEEKLAGWFDANRENKGQTRLKSNDVVHIMDSACGKVLIIITKDDKIT